MPFTDTATGTFLVPGPAGASAYDAWQALGNTGTLADFIAAQKGEPGNDSTVPGPPGRQGDPGAGTIVAAVRSATVVPSTYVVRLADGTCVTANPRNAAHQGLVIGLDVIGGPPGSVAQVTALGPISGVSGAFSAGDAIWIGDGTTGRLGSPVNVPPAASSSQDIWRQQVGTASTASVINGLLGLPYRVRASAVPALVGNGSYIALSTVGQAVVQAVDAPTARAAIGAVGPSDLASKWDDNGVAPQTKKINFRQKKFLACDYGLAPAVNDTLSMSSNVVYLNQMFSDLKSSAGGGHIVIDDTYYLNASIDQTIPTGHHCKIEGHHSGASLWWNGSGVTAGLAVRAGAIDTIVGLKNLRLHADGCPNIGNFITVRGGGGKQGLDVGHLCVEGSASARPANYVTLINPYNCDFVGLNVEAGNVGSYGSTGVAFQVYGDKANGASICVDFSFIACLATRTSTGFVLTPATSGAHTLEGASFTDCVLAGVQTGLNYQSGGDLTPGLTWKGGHINASKYGAVLGNIAQFKFDDMLFYMDVGNSPIAAVQFQNGSYDCGVLNSTVFLVDTTSTGLMPSINHFIVTGASRHIQISNVLCETYTADPCIRVDAGSISTVYEKIRKVNANHSGPAASGPFVSDGGIGTLNWGNNALL